MYSIRVGDSETNSSVEIWSWIDGIVVRDRRSADGTGFSTTNQHRSDDRNDNYRGHDRPEPASDDSAADRRQNDRRAQGAAKDRKGSCCTQGKYTTTLHYVAPSSIRSHSLTKFALSCANDSAKVMHCATRVSLTLLNVVRPSIRVDT